MAVRAIMKKIIISPPKIRLMEGGLIKRVPARCFSINTTTVTVLTEDHRRDDYLNNEAVVCDLERILKDGKIPYDDWIMDYQFRKPSEFDNIDERWENWVESSHELWKKKNEEEQRKNLDMYWKYLKDYLHRKGVDTSNHGLLLSMKKIVEPPYDDPPLVSEETIVEFILASPDRGLVSINRLVLDCSWPCLPRQTVKGLLCITTNGAFLIYNPITGEASPWIETNNKLARNRIAFGFDPQSGEHKVICVSSSSNSDSVSDDHNNNQVVEVLTVGKNTWRRIHAIPPIAIGDDEQVPYYVDGCLYWRFRGDICKPRKPELIMKFDIVAEKFRVIPIPDFVVDPCNSKLSLSVGITEIDGRIAVLERRMSLWIMHEDADGNIKWTEEELDEPDDWNGKPDLSIVALTGTNLIFLQSPCSDNIFYYNRKTEESVRFPTSPDCEWCDQWKRTIQV
ncbi:hypothetical protein MKX03_005461 [Papaver bracteatum]|nr:hypothetical protein MKX03_005461 [Papaver bracteatum]